MGRRISFSDIAVIYEEYQDILYSYALHLGFDEPTAMDAIHDVFYKLCIHHASLDKISNLKSYLFRSLRNRLIDIHRTNKEYHGLSSDQEDIDENIPFQFNVTIEDEMIKEEDAKEVQRKVEDVLNRLTDRQREIVYLRFIGEYSYEEIAEIMQISVESGRNLISKSLTKLRGSSLPIALFLLIVR